MRQSFELEYRCPRCGSTDWDAGAGIISCDECSTRVAVADAWRHVRVLVAYKPTSADELREALARYGLVPIAGM